MSLTCVCVIGGIQKKIESYETSLHDISTKVKEASQEISQYIKRKNACKTSIEWVRSEAEMNKQSLFRINQR